MTDVDDVTKARALLQDTRLKFQRGSLSAASARQQQGQRAPRKRARVQDRKKKREVGVSQ